MPELKEVFEMTTKQMDPDLDSWREQEKRQRKANRNKKFGAFAVAAVISLVAVVVILGTRAEQKAIPPGNDRSADPVEVATNFLEAYGASDANQAMTYLADDADIAEWTGAGEGVGALDGLLLSISMNEAVGYEQMLDPCEETSSGATGTSVRCAFDFHFLRSDEIGRGPYSGSYFDLRVRDGEIVRASTYFETERFSPQMWEPFERWVSANYPGDAAVMYEDETHTSERLTVESIRLWERHSRGYVKEVKQGGAGQ